MKNLRSLLFMPGNNPAMLASADNLGADALIFDLEDAVALEEKDAARALVRQALLTLPKTNSYVTVRINPIDSPYWQEDLAAILDTDLDGIVIPKASVLAINTVENFVEEYFAAKFQSVPDKLNFLMLIETAQGILEAVDIAKASSRINALLLGGEDYSVSMGVKRTYDSHELAYARYHLATVAKAYNLDAIDTPYTDFEDLEGLKKDSDFSKSIGFNGRMVINPRQIKYIHQLLSPTAAEIETASAILALAIKAKEQGLGVFSFQGKMVDKPVITRAENLVALAKKWGLID